MLSRCATAPPKMARLVLVFSLVLLGMLARSEALQCYACREERNIPGITISNDIKAALSRFPSCKMFKPEEPEKKFIQQCNASEKVCIRIEDPKDSMNQLRSCFPLGKVGCKNSACYCEGDLCNGSSLAWPSLVLMVTSLMALLFRAH